MSGTRLIPAKRVFKNLGRAAVTAAILVVFFVPFWWMILTALKTSGETLRFPPTFWVSQPQWQNFGLAFKAFPFMKFLGNSLLITAAVLICQVLTVIPAAYAFARYSFKGKRLLFGLTLASVMIPAQLIFLPVFILMSTLGLINQYASLILPSAASAFGIFMLTQTFRQVPEEILEAARLDKASELKIILRIMVPIARPTIAALGLLTFIAVWNDYFWPLVLTTNDSVRTLPLGVASLRLIESGLSIPYHIVMAGNLLLILPIILIFVFAQQQIITAFTYMGEK